MIEATIEQIVAIPVFPKEVCLIVVDYWKPRSGDLLYQFDNQEFDDEKFDGRMALDENFIYVLTENKKNTTLRIFSKQNFMQINIQVIPKVRNLLIEVDEKNIYLVQLNRSKNHLVGTLIVILKNNMQDQKLFTLSQDYIKREFVRNAMAIDGEYIYISCDNGYILKFNKIDGKFIQCYKYRLCSRACSHCT